MDKFNFAVRDAVAAAATDAVAKVGSITGLYGAALTVLTIF